MLVGYTFDYFAFEFEPVTPMYEGLLGFRMKQEEGYFIFRSKIGLSGCRI